MRTYRDRFFLILKVILFTLAAVIVVMNLMPSEEILDHKIENAPEIGSEEFHQVLGHLLGPPLVAGNKVQSLYNGSEIFPAMLEAIRGAQHSITFEAYIYGSDSIGEKFISALIDRAQAGVRVHMLIDWMGSREFKDESFEKLKEAGVEIEFYRAPSLSTLTQLNNRTHRRILVVDGKVGFTGGVGINNEWDGNGDLPELWRDSQFRIEGPVVNSLQAAFMDNWLKLRSEVLHDERYFPKLSPQGQAWAQVFKSSPGAGSESIRLMYQLVIASARKSIRLSSAYFLPDDLAVQELIKARERGVRVQIIVPGKYLDTHIVKNASQARWGDLLKAGVEIYEFQPAKYHCKVLIVDELFVSVGSTNFDNRSFQLNDEGNLNVLDRDFAATEIEAFEKDKAQSRKVTFEDWNERPEIQKWKELFSSLLETQL